MLRYSLKIINEGDFKGALAVYQRQHDLEAMGAMPLAWFTQKVFPNMHAEFSWDKEYNFILSKEGELIPGVVFKAVESVDTSPEMHNMIEIDKGSDGYVIKKQVTDHRRVGKLVIEGRSGIPEMDASIGIAMSGSGTFAWEAEPNVSMEVEPKPEYWITYGDFRQGEVLDTRHITKKSLKIDYPRGKYGAVVVLKKDNTWGNVVYM